jgi:DNA-binding transcriptional LysR family regulator
MFSRLFAQSGLSLDRLRALVEVGAAGSIVRAAGNDPVRQSQFSRQLKELEDFFQTGLVERHGRGLRLTASGKELARISRFFLLGLSNFQRGCLAEGQAYRIGASATFIEVFLLPILADPGRIESGVRFTIETVAEQEIERRLHDLTLDFGVVCREALSRPLQVRELGMWRLRLLVPKKVCKSESQAVQAFMERRLPVAWPAGELPPLSDNSLENYKPALTCGSFLEARAALEREGLAALLPDFLATRLGPGRLLVASTPQLNAARFRYHLAWNPRLLRLNPHARRRKDALISALARKLSGNSLTHNHRSS